MCMCQCSFKHSMLSADSCIQGPHNVTRWYSASGLLSAAVGFIHFNQMGSGLLNNNRLKRAHHRPPPQIEIGTWHTLTQQQQLLVSECMQCYTVLSGDTTLMQVGTSSVVYPAAMFAPMLAQRGVPVAEFNIEETPVTHQLG